MRSPIIVLIIAVSGLLCLPVQNSAAPAGLSQERIDAVLQELGVEKDKWNQGADILKSALKIDPGDADAAAKLAILRLNFEDHYELSSIRRQLSDAVKVGVPEPEALDLWLSLNPTETELQKMRQALQAPAMDGEAVDPWVTMGLARVLMGLGNHKEGRRLLVPLFETDDVTTRNQARLYAAISNFEDGELEKEGITLYDEMIEELDAETEKNLRAQTLIIATDREKEEYANLELEQKADFYRAFWKKRDTFPMSDVSERLPDHYRRIRIALDKFGLESNGAGYFTQKKQYLDLTAKEEIFRPDELWTAWQEQSYWIDPRGIMYIRHGKPDRVVRNMSSAQIETWIYIDTTVCEEMPEAYKDVADVV
ncbi:GWxTD domain-containing protein, partial [Acidobacteriota bacterium]